MNTRLYIMCMLSHYMTSAVIANKQQSSLYLVIYVGCNLLLQLTKVLIDHIRIVWMQVNTTALLYLCFASPSYS